MDMEKFERGLETREQRDAKKIKEEDRKTKRMAPIEELSLRNRRCHKRISKVHNATRRSYGEETYIILDRLEEKDGYIAGKINSNQTMDAYSRNVRYSEINFYFLSDEEAAEIRENPFQESTGVDKTGRYIGQEKAYNLDPTKDSSLFDSRVDTYRAGKTFNPIGAIQRYRATRRISDTLDQFEQSMDMIESAIADPSLNPALVELAQQQEVAQQTA
jgi:hypothetical protein